MNIINRIVNNVSLPFCTFCIEQGRLIAFSLDPEEIALQCDLPKLVSFLEKYKAADYNFKIKELIEEDCKILGFCSKLYFKF